jgi:AraC-like DNA-binding protein
VSRTRQRFPDGSVWVRTYPLTHLHDHVTRPHRHEWHQLTFALRGHIELDTDLAHWSIPTDHALWVPSGVSHRETLRAPVTVRTLYLAPGAVPRASRSCRALEVSPLLRELVAHASVLGALDHRRARDRRLIGVLLDQLAAAPAAELALPLPRDPRARRLAELVERAPDRPLAQLVRVAGASLRTLERCFAHETGMSLGTWRRRRRLFHARALISGGASVTAAADAAGYATVSAMSEAFRRELGRSPTGRRRAHPRQ